MKVSRYFFISLLVTLIALAAFAVSASAQSIYGSIRGLVTDPSSAIVANAKVTLINEGTSDQRTATTNTSGEYVFSQVTPGTYTVDVETQGFKKVQRKGVILETQNQLTVDMQLEVGNVAESVSVTNRKAIARPDIMSGRSGRTSLRPVATASARPCTPWKP